MESAIRLSAELAEDLMRNIWICRRKQQKVSTNTEDVQIIKFSRADRVLSLLTVNSNLKVHDTTMPIDSLLLFQRITVMKRTNEGFAPTWSMN